MLEKLPILLIFLAIPLLSWGQELTIRGTIISATDSEPIIGANVLVKGRNEGTVTDIDGNFSLRAGQTDVLIISYIGFETVEVPVEGRSELNITMTEDTQLLDEIVAVGYVTQRKIDLTGAVGVVDMNTPLSQSNANPLNSLQGKIAGVQINTDTAPGGGSTSIRIRGMSTTNNNSPLYVIDGVPTTENLNSLNANDIESIQVLKDASSASIYGSRASNGVVVITTKKGKGNKLTVDINMSGSLQTVIKTYDMLNSQEWGEVFWQANKNAGLNPSHPFYGNGPEPRLRQYLDTGKLVAAGSTDWQDAIYREAWAQNYSATITNNTEKSSTMFSTNYTKQDGLLDYTYFQRYSARLNTTYKLSEYVSVGENLMIAKWSNTGYSTQDDRGIPFTAMRQHPAIPVFDNNGEYTNPLALAQSDIANPIKVLDKGRDNTSNSWRIFGNTYLEITPLPGLALKSNLGIEHIQYFNQELNRKIQESDKNSVSRAYGEGDTWTWTNTASYDIALGKHKLFVFGGSEAISYKFSDLFAYRDGYQFEDRDYMIINSGEGTQTNGGGKTSWALFSLFGKADYNYDDRYLLSATIRRDATSRLHKDNNSGIFPSFSGAWRLSEEDFIPESDWTDNIKVRIGWGQTGNSAISNNYAAYSTYRYDTGNGAYDLTASNSGAIAGIIVSAMGNENLKWETTTQTNIGLDLGFLRNRLNVALDYYWKNTKDMLTIPPTLAVAGENAAIWTNTGSMKNRGFELTTSYISPQYNKFSWGATLNLSQYKNEVTKLNNLVKFEGADYRLMEGKPMGVYYGYVADGLFQTDDEVRNHARQEGKGLGRIKYRDLNFDGIIDDRDQTVIGDPNPDFSMGLNIDLTYGNFELSCFFTGDFGFDIYNTTKRQLDFMTYGGTSTNRSVSVLNSWTPENTKSTIPALTVIDTNNEARMSTYYVEDGSYLKMKFIKLSYTIPNKLIRNIGINNMNLFSQLENVFTITGYSGLDPELPLSLYGAKVDRMPYPVARTFSAGINLNF